MARLQTLMARAAAGQPCPVPDEPTNADRAKWADVAMKAFRKQTRCDEEDSLGDLLANLMHWADANNFDFEAALICGSGHYRAEVEEES